MRTSSWSQAVGRSGDREIGRAGERESQRGKGSCAVCEGGCRCGITASAPGQEGAPWSGPELGHRRRASHVLAVSVSLIAAISPILSPVSCLPYPVSCLPFPAVPGPTSPMTLSQPEKPGPPPTAGRIFRATFILHYINRPYDGHPARNALGAAVCCSDSSSTKPSLLPR